MPNAANIVVIVQPKAIATATEGDIETTTAATKVIVQHATGTATASAQLAEG